MPAHTLHGGAVPYVSASNQQPYLSETPNPKPNTPNPGPLSVFQTYPLHICNVRITTDSGADACGDAAQQRAECARKDQLQHQAVVGHQWPITPWIGSTFSSTLRVFCVELRAALRSEDEPPVAHDSNDSAGDDDGLAASFSAGAELAKAADKMPDKVDLGDPAA